MLKKRTNITTAVINAGGLGSRLKDINGNLPKALTKFNGEAIIIGQIRNFINYGADEFIIFLGHEAAQIQQAILENFQDGNFVFCHEEIPLGSGGPLIKHFDTLPEQFYFTYCDIAFDVDLYKLHEFHLQTSSDLTVVVHPNDHPQDSDLIVMNEETKKIECVQAHPHDEITFTRNLVNAAFYLINRAVLKQISVQETGKKLDFAQNMLPELVKSERVFAYHTFEFLKDIGTPKRLRKAEKYFSQRFRSDGTNRVIMLDRDGTINSCGIGEYIRHPDDLELLPDVEAAIKTFRELGYFVVVVTNQPIIARGDVTTDELAMIHGKLDWTLAKYGAYIDKYYYCPHHPNSGYEGEIPALKIKCNCRKPGIDLLNQVNIDLGINRDKSFMVGDSLTDVEAAIKFGTNPVLLAPPAALAEKAVKTFTDLQSFAEWLKLHEQ